MGHLRCRADYLRCRKYTRCAVCFTGPFTESHPYVGPFVVYGAESLSTPPPSTGAPATTPGALVEWYMADGGGRGLLESTARTSALRAHSSVSAGAALEAEAAAAAAAGLSWRSSTTSRPMDCAEPTTDLRRSDVRKGCARKGHVKPPERPQIAQHTCALKEHP